ncbi:hypothetical protein [Alicyclobacillus sp.]|uniref:hypothetical protein n=1 Tax=Alicyclobacillus sp. TaxID=61169 RepID=UPI0025BDCC19|nr:hypothetical protein [Alicyclobacillus sp.]MCL6515724.1 hypothetical protein [Alicyclobacillus sp.]
MIWIHALLGWVTLLAAFAVCVWAWLGASGRTGARLPSRVLIGLIDLQILVGIITWVLHRMWNLHPILGIAAAVVAHVWLKDRRSRTTQAWAATAVFILLGITAWIGR